MADSKLSKAVLKEQLADDFDAVFSPQGSAAMVEKLRSVPISDGPQYIEKAEKIADYRIIDNLAQRWLRHEPAPFVEKLVQELGGFAEEELFADNVALRALAPETQDFILTLADRIRSIRLTEQADAQLITLDRVSSPLPTAEDLARDPRMTWVGRDRGKIALDEDGQSRPESPLDFFRRVYAPWIGFITKADVRRSDPKLYEALDNWSRRTKTQVPPDILPTYHRHKKSEKVTEEDMKMYNKISAMYNRRARERKKA